MIELVETNASGIAAEFVRARIRSGSPVMGMVMTLVVLCDEKSAHEALKAAREASHLHPARVLCVISGSPRGAAHIDAQVGTGDSGWTGEVAVIRLRGEVTKHADSIVLPLLLPDSPVVAWWPTDHPDDPAVHPVGALAQRRITDTAGVTRGKAKSLLNQCAAYCPGNTDLSWTRLTLWRALLASSLDQHPVEVTGASVTAERNSPSARLMAAWLSERLGVPIEEHSSSGPGITEVVLRTKKDEIVLSRGDGLLGMLRSPGAPDRPVALKRRTVPELLVEELRHLDEDDVYAATVRHLLELSGEEPSGEAASSGTPNSGTTGSGARKPARAKNQAGKIPRSERGDSKDST